MVEQFLPEITFELGISITYNEFWKPFNLYIFWQNISAISFAEYDLFIAIK